MIFSLYQEERDMCRPCLDPVIHTCTKTFIEHLLCSGGLYWVLWSVMDKAGSFQPGQKSANQRFYPVREVSMGCTDSWETEPRTTSSRCP